MQANLKLPVVLVGAVAVLALGLSLGDIFHGQFYNPLAGRPSQQLSAANLASLNDIYGVLQRHYDGKLDQAKLLDGARSGLVAATGDPYTSYLTAKDAKTLQDDLDGQLSGIGAEIGIKNNFVTVVAPIDETPAARAGLKPQDIIARINDEDTTGMSVDTAVSKIRGEAGTTVKLKLIRGSQPAFDVSITREQITVKSVKWELKPNNVGYIEVSRFGSDTTSLIDQASVDLKAKGARKIVLDLRNNPGGYLEAGVAVASEFLPKGKLVVEQRRGSKSIDKQTAYGGGDLVGLPMIVLVNGGSASAAEIVAGALRDAKAATIYGEKTFGKGSVQEIKPLPGGAEVKVTVAHWYTPAGVNIGREGIKPDIEIKQTPEDYSADRDPQLDAALAKLSQ